MDVVEARRVIEGILFVAGEPVSLKRLKEVLEEADHAAVRQLITQLSEDYIQTHRALRIQEVAGGYQLVTDPTLAPWMQRALALPREALLSHAALETLAIVAYRQPITKAEMEVIRGVDVTGTLERLMERQFVRVVGRKDTPGRPILYGTTVDFLRHFGLKSLEALPPMTQPGTIPSLAQQALEPATPTPDATEESSSVPAAAPSAH